MDEQQKRKYIKRYFKKCIRINGVQNAIVFNRLGIPKRSTFDRAETIRLVGFFDDLLLKIKLAIQIIDDGDQFVSVRLRTNKFEIFISKDLDDIYFVVFQNANGTRYNIPIFHIHKTFSFKQWNRSINKFHAVFLFLLSSCSTSFVYFVEKIHTTRFKPEIYSKRSSSSSSSEKTTESKQRRQNKQIRTEKTFTFLIIL